MSIYIFRSWWHNCYQKIKCVILRIEIWFLLYSESDEIAMNQVESLIKLEKYRNPGKSESWYLEKIIYDCRRKFLT